jgi:hypothetical protein
MKARPCCGVDAAWSCLLPGDGRHADGMAANWDAAARHLRGEGIGAAASWRLSLAATCHRPGRGPLRPQFAAGRTAACLIRTYDAEGDGWTHTVDARLAQRVWVD